MGCKIALNDYNKKIESLVSYREYYQLSSIQDVKTCKLSVIFSKSLGYFLGDLDLKRVIDSLKKDQFKIYLRV